MILIPITSGRDQIKVIMKLIQICQAIVLQTLMAPESWLLESLTMTKLMILCLLTLMPRHSKHTITIHNYKTTQMVILSKLTLDTRFLVFSLLRSHVICKTWCASLLIVITKITLLCVGINSLWNLMVLIHSENILLILWMECSSILLVNLWCSILMEILQMTSFIRTTTKILSWLYATRAKKLMVYIPSKTSSQHMWSLQVRTLTVETHQELIWSQFPTVTHISI